MKSPSSPAPHQAASDPLLAGVDGFPAARARAGNDPLLAAMARELRRRCDELFDPAAARHLDPDDLDSRWWQSRNGNKQLVNAVTDLAFAGAFFDDARHATLAIRVLDNLAGHDMIEHGGRKGGLTPTGGRDGWHGPLDMGPASEMLGLALDWLRPHLDDRHGATIAAYLQTFTDRLAAVNGPIRDQDPPVLINATVIGKVGDGSGVMALSRWLPIDGEAAQRGARKAALQYLNEGGHEEGVLVEGPMYGFGVLKHIAVLGALLAQGGDRAIWESEGWDRIVDAYCTQLLPDGQLNMLNDAYAYCPSCWLLAAARYRRNGLARWLWEQTVQPLTLGRWDPDMPWDYRPAWWNGFVPLAMIFYDPAVAPVTPETADLPLRRHFRGRGLLTIRSGWDPHDFSVAMTCTPDIRWRNRVHKQHAQADRGHFSLNALGEQFLIDVGYGHESMDDTPKVLAIGHTGEAHSVPVIDGRAQRGSTLAIGFTEVRTEAWAPLGRVEYGSAYPEALAAYRTLAAVPDADGQLLYLVVHDFLSIGGGGGKRGLLFQGGWDAGVEIVSRQEADLIGPRRGHRCRIIASANCPGIFKWEPMRYYPGRRHPRLRYEWEDSSINALSVIVPYRQDEAPPRFERTDVNDNRGFAARLRFRDVADVMILNVAHRFAGMGYESDGQFTLIREGAAPRVLVVDGSVVRRGATPLWSAPHRTVFATTVG